MTELHDIPARWLALWNGDTDALDGLVAADAVTHAVLAGTMEEGRLAGRDALGGWIAQIRGMIPTLRFAIEVGPLVDGDLVALRWRATGGTAAPRVNFTGTDTLRVEGGLIAEYWVNSDTQLMMAQIEAGQHQCKEQGPGTNAIATLMKRPRERRAGNGRLKKTRQGGRSAYSNEWSFGRRVAIAE